MCLLAVFFRVVEDAPLVAGANREEQYSRGGEPPRILDGSPKIIAGVDPTAGGTWFGVNEGGVLVAVTNRLKSNPPSKPRSRGLLARDLLTCHSAAAALELAMRELGKNAYAGCNFLCADAERAVVLHAGDWLRVRMLPPGIHVLTSHDVNDASDSRLGYAHWWLSEHTYANAAACVTALKELCSQPGGTTPPICLHGERGGTVSSSIVSLRPALRESTYWHAQGSPDQTPYADFSDLLRQLAGRA